MLNGNVGVLALVDSADGEEPNCLYSSALSSPNVSNRKNSASLLGTLWSNVNSISPITVVIAPEKVTNQ